MAAVAFITASGGFAGNNLYWKNRLVNTHGDTVTGIVDNNAEATDFSSYDFIIIGWLVDAGHIGANMKAETLPIVVLRRVVDTELGMANSNGSIGSDDVDVQDDTHYITLHLTAGNWVCYGSAQSVQYHDGTGNDMEDLITRTGMADRPCLNVCEKGNTLNDGTTAADRRIFWGLYDDDDQTADSLKLFDNIRSWCLYEDAIKIWLLNAVNSL